MKKIFIPFKSYNGNVGGPITFMKNLKVEFDKSGVEYQSKPWFAKCMFFPMSSSQHSIRFVKAFGGKIIQRLDGVYYPSKNPENYKNANRGMQHVYSKYSDYVIFQSEYSKKQVFEMFGSLEKGKYSLICNGANQNIFYPIECKGIHKKVRFITTGSFRNKDMIDPVIKALDLLEEKGYDFELNLLGPIKVENKESILAKKYVVNSQSKDQHIIAEALRNSDVFIYSHLNPPCPNSVIEAVSCGLPVVGFDSGAMTEICHFNKELFAYVSEDVFQVYEDFDYKKLAEKLELSIGNFDL